MTRALPAIDVLDHKEVEHVDRLTTRGGKLNDLRVGDRERTKLPEEGRLDSEPLIILPEVGVVGEQLREREKESPPHVDSPARIGHALDAVHPIENVEEQLDVVPKRCFRDLGHRGIETGCE